MKGLSALGAALVALACVWPARAASTAEFAQEVSRVHQDNGRVVSFWWLPVEYWVQSARERSYPEDEVAKVRKAFELYSVVGVLDGRARDKGALDVATHQEIAERLSTRVRQQPTAPLHDFDPNVARILPELAYPLRVSLGPLRDGLRLFVFPNANEEGGPLLSGGRDGVFEIAYSLDAASKPLVFRWHAPLNVVVGAQTDPMTGEHLDASWRYNPWTGEKLR